MSAPTSSPPSEKNTSLISKARERSRVRRVLLKHTLGVDDLSTALGGKKRRDRGEDCAAVASIGGLRAGGEGSSRLSRSPVASTRTGESSAAEFSQKSGRDGSGEADADEFRDSTAFLKGTQSLNPHNDYSQVFSDLVTRGVLQ